jgi:hypothetical protein
MMPSTAELRVTERQELRLASRIASLGVTMICQQHTEPPGDVPPGRIVVSVLFGGSGSALSRLPGRRRRFGLPCSREGLRSVAWGRPLPLPDRFRPADLRHVVDGRGAQPHPRSASDHVTTTPCSSLARCPVNP